MFPSSLRSPFVITKMSVVISAGKKNSLDDIIRVAVNNQPILLAGGSVPVKSAGTNPVIAQRFSAQTDVAGIERLPRSICRAGLLCYISFLMQSRAPNMCLLETVARLLNDNIVPAFSTSESANNELITFLSNGGVCYSNENDDLVDSAFLDVKVVCLTNEEAEQILAYPFLAVGLGCIVAAASMNFIRLIDSVSALSCEAVGSNAEPYDAANFEVCRPHRGQMLSASNLRLLLDGSKRTGSYPKDKLPVLVSLHNAPQVTGPCRDVIIASVKAIEIEMNSYESTPSRKSNGTAFNGSQAQLITQNLLAALDTLIGAARERSAAVSSVRNCLVQQPATTTAPATSAASFNQVFQLVDALGMELVASLGALGNQEAEEAAAALAKMELAEKNKAANEGAKQGGKGKPEASDDSNLTPEQKARAEAKRREKAEKAAQKSAAKEQKKAGGATVPLGAGSTLVRAYIQKHCQTVAGGANGGGVTLQAMQALLNPFDQREDSFAAYCAKVLEQLNSGGKFKPKIAKGARDFGPEQMRIREQAFSAIRRVFKRHGGVEIDTPVFELKELLTGKYGEDSKLIYDLADQGGELLSLRYDLTVPFARFLAMRSVGNIKRFHIAKVYRRDQPQAARGRFREFYQCDFDIAGSFSPMVADAEVITVATEILTDLPVGKFCIKLNHRKLLDAIFELSGVPAEKFRPICSAVDKLDKMSWEEVKKEMVEEKGLAPEAADRIATFVLHSGEPMELWNKFTEMRIFGDHVQANAAMADLKLLFDYLEAMGSLQYVSFDMSLARGLDYYTGVIYEAVLIDGAVSVGSIAAGGRYDNLVGMFSPAGVQTPCVGVSIGIERVFAIMEKKAEELNIMQSTGIQVYIASIGANLIAERMKVAQALWKANISAEYPHQDNPKFKKQLDDALERSIPFMVVFGSEELAKGVVKVKDMRKHTEVEVAREDLVRVLVEQGCVAVGAGADSEFLEALKASSATAAEPETSNA